MNNLFNNIEKILSAQSDDLEELAKLVGVDPREMYVCADLSGVNLTNRDVSFLGGLNTRHGRSDLTKRQAEHLKRSNAGNRASSQFQKDTSLRALTIKNFIEGNALLLASEFPERSRDDIEKVLVAAMLQPVEKRPSLSSLWEFNGTYSDSVIQAMIGEGFFDSLYFAEHLLQLFGQLACEGSDRTAALLDRALLRYSVLTQRPHLIGQWKPNIKVIIGWINNAKSTQECQDRAIEVIKFVPVDADMLIGFIRLWQTAEVSIRLLEASCARYGRDDLEKIVYQIVIQMERPEQVAVLLNADVSPTSKQVFIRQVLSRGGKHNVETVVNWMSGQPEGVGGIAISDAVQGTGNFDDAYGICRNVHRHLGSAQRAAMLSTLEAQARTEQQRRRVDNLRSGA